MSARRLDPDAPEGGWMGLCQPTGPDTVLDASALVDAQLRKAGWDGDPATRERAILLLLRDRNMARVQIGRRAAVEHYDREALRVRRGAAGRTQKANRHAETRQAVERVVEACRAEFLPVTPKNCLTQWPEDLPRPHRNTVAKHLKDMGLTG